MRSFHIVAALACVVHLAAPAVHAVGEPDELMPGRSVVVKPQKLLRFVAKPPAGTTFDLPDPTNAPTVEGATLDVFDTALLLNGLSFSLPSTGWKALSSSGFRYKGTGLPSDPCKSALIRGTVVKAICRGVGVELDTPFFGEAGISLNVGTDGKRYCASFGGSEGKNDPRGLKRRNAPPPSVCPAFTVSTGPTSTVTTTTSSTSSTVSTTSSSTNSPNETTTTSTTSTTRIVCCEVPPPVFCSAGITDVQCAGLGTVGGEGTVCDATGDCVPPPGVAGDCCEFSGDFGPYCFMPLSEFCSGASHPAAVCQASGMCSP